jgi:hypothetical protein
LWDQQGGDQPADYHDFFHQVAEGDGEVQA